LGGCEKWMAARNEWLREMGGCEKWLREMGGYEE